MTKHRVSWFALEVFLLGALVAAMGASACSGGHDGAMDGGAPGTGGASASGGRAAGGAGPNGQNATGGASATGGTAGGRPGNVATGGRASGGGGGGAPATGGRAEGGALGGTFTGGNATGGLGARGGAPATGGNAGDHTGGSSGGGPQTFLNGLQWADTRGKPVQAHGGGILKVGDEYYWFGENRNADSTFYAVSAYRSRDLRNWEYRADVLKMSSAAELKPANIERPKVVYNATTKKFVMWMHWENGKDYGEARAAVAVGDTVDGEYTYLGSKRPLVDSGVTDHGKPGYMSRDCNLFVDDDGKAYFISSTNENTDLNLYLLSDDYLSVSKLAATLFKGSHREAPVIFKRSGVYFLLSSAATGWDPNQGQYATSTSLTSGWSALANLGDGTTFYSQPTCVVAVAGTSSASGTEYLYLGDRWAGAWGGRVNDSAYLGAPMTFASSTKVSMSWDDTLTIDTQAGTVRGAITSFKVVNKKSGLFLDVAAGAADNGAAVIQSVKAAGATTSQDWSRDYDGAGYEHLVNKKTSKLLEVNNESTADGATVDQWGSNGGDHQAWLIVDLGNGTYRVKNKKSGRYLSVLGAATAEGAAVEQRAMSTGDEQLWLFVPSS